VTVRTIHAEIAASDPASVRARSGWIIDARWDSAMFLGAPLLLFIVAELALIQGTEMLIVAVGTVGGIGHHLPGLLRAYGDRELFARHWLRLVLGPALFAVLCSTFVFGDLEGLSFIILMWGVWHAMAQVYGMGRVYDAKIGHLSARTAILDKAVCITWFGLVLVLSSERLRVILTELLKCGLPAISADAIFMLRWTAMVVTLVTTSAWFLDVIDSHRSARPMSVTKVVFFVGSISFWWYANISVQNVIIGVALFEILHDVHYLGFVWRFKRGQVENLKHPSNFSDALFRAKSSSVLLYVALVVAYGAFFRANEALLSGLGLQVIGVFVLVSTLLHFYTDSFIWNLRDRATRVVLDVDEPAASMRAHDDGESCLG